MITLGIDLSSAREGTAASLIDWKKSPVVVHILSMPWLRA